MRDLVIPPAVMKEAAKNATAAAALLNDIKRMLRAPTNLTPEEQSAFQTALRSAQKLLDKAVDGIRVVEYAYWEQLDKENAAKKAKATAVKLANDV